MKWNSRIAVFLTALVVLTLTFGSLRYFGRYQPFADLMQNRFQANEQSPIVDIENALIVGRSRGKRQWSVHCGSLTLSRDWRSVRVNDISDAVLLDSNGNSALRVHAARGLYYSPSGVLADLSGTNGRVTIEGGIVAQAAIRPEMKLEAGSIAWEGQDQMAYCTDGIVGVFPEGRLQSQSAVLNTRNGNLTLKHLYGKFAVSTTVY